MKHFMFTAAIVLSATVATLAGQQPIPFDLAVKELADQNADVRLRAAKMLRDSAYPEAAVPLATAVADPSDDVQLEAIAAELNIFMAEKVTARKRNGAVASAGEEAFSRGALAVSARPVPTDVLTALRVAARDENNRVATEAVYAFGELAGAATGSTRRALLRVSAPDLAALLGGTDPRLRVAAARAIGRLFAPRPGDDPVDMALGDALISTLNDSNRTVVENAMRALGDLRYERSVQGLTELFRHYEKGELAVAALDSLARIAHRSSAPVFASQLDSKTPALRISAIEGLVRIGDRSALTQIESARGGSRNDAVQLAEAFASTMLGAGAADAVADALGKARLHDQAKQYMIEIARTRPGDFTRLTSDPDASRRAELAEILGLTDSPAALPAAETLAKDPAPNVSQAAQRAVERLKAASTRPS